MSRSNPVKPPLLMAYGLATLCAMLPSPTVHAHQPSSNSSWIPICIGAAACTFVEALTGDAYPDGAVCTSTVQCGSEVCSQGRCLRSAGRLCESNLQCASGLCLDYESPGYCAEVNPRTCSTDSDCNAGNCDRGYCIGVAVPNLAASSDPDSIGNVTQTPERSLPAHPTPNELGYLSAEQVADELSASGEVFAPAPLIDEAQ
jgi:hypothetical protein